MKFKYIAATATAILMANAAHASVVTSTTPIVVPNNIDGVYINLVTGATGTSGTGTPGYDFNPYAASSTLSFFWPSTASGSSGGVASSTGQYLDLTTGSVVSSASIFSTTPGSTPTTAFRTTGTHILGLRFLNEATGAINYGYVTLSTTAATGFPATILGWSYENTGAAITVGGAAAAVPEPATWGLMLAGFGMVGSGLRRRSTVKTTVSYA